MKTDIYWNISDQPIFIQIGPMKRDPFGGPGETDTRMIIEPGMGIDLNILGLSSKKPIRNEKPLQ